MKIRSKEDLKDLLQDEIMNGVIELTASEVIYLLGDPDEMVQYLAKRVCKIRGIQVVR